MGEEREFMFNASSWYDEGINLIPIEAFSFDGEIDGLIANLGFVNEYEEMSISNTFKELFSISFSENYMPFLLYIDPDDNTEADVLLVSMRIMNKVYAEIKELEDTLVFAEINPALEGSLDKIKELTNAMIEGDLSCGDELFDMMYGISIVQDLNNEKELDTAVFDLMSLLTPIVENNSSFDLETIAEELESEDFDSNILSDNAHDALKKAIEIEYKRALLLEELLEIQKTYSENLTKLIKGVSEYSEEELKEIIEFNDKAEVDIKALRKAITKDLED